MIPLATTTVTVAREESGLDVDPYDAAQPAPTTITTGVRAVVGAPSANVALSGGDRVVYTSTLRADPCDLQADDTVTDATTGLVWVVLWARRVTAVGQDMMTAQLRLVTGAT